MRLFLIGSLTVVLAAAASVAAPRAAEPLILSVTPDLEAGLLVITGDRLDRASVTLYGEVLAISHSSRELLVARLPKPAPPPGSYLLTVAPAAAASPVAVFEVSLPGATLRPAAAGRKSEQSGGTGGIPAVLARLEAMRLQAEADRTALEGRLDELQAQLAAHHAAVSAELAGLSGPQSSATFCISQEQAVALGLDWAIGLPAEVEGGVGWAEVGDAKLTAAPSFPIIIPVTPLPPAPPIPILIPVPTELAVGLAGGLGRGLEICIDLPLTLSPDDEAILARLAEEINAETGNGGDGQPQGKFQRRAGRVLAYADRRIPDPEEAGAAGAESIEDEFDLADVAADDLLEKGIGAVSDGLDVFSNQKIRDLLGGLEVPADVKDFMNNPDRIFDGLPDLNNGFDALGCEDLGVSKAMSDRNPRLAKLCDELDALPSFELVRDAFGRIDDLPLSKDVVDAMTELLEPLLKDAGETAEQTKSRFCTKFGDRKAFKKFCSG